MTEIIQPGALKTPKKRRGLKALDIGVFLILAVIIIALLVTLFGKLQLKHEVSAAREVSDRAISDLAKQNAGDAHNLGSKSFQSKHPTAQLQSLFASAQSFAHSTPSVDRQTVSNSKQAQTVYIIYKYAGKSPYYVRITTSKAAGDSSWKLIGISGNTTESSLIVK